jgi:deoxyribodipyrimidine photo-lyase
MAGITDEQRARTEANKATALARRAAALAAAASIDPEAEEHTRGYTYNAVGRQSGAAAVATAADSPPLTPVSPRPNTTTVVASERCRRLNFKPCNTANAAGRGASGRYVLLWVQSAQRARHNEALEFAVQRANEHGVPLLAIWGGTAGFPGSSERHLGFIYEGLVELRQTLEATRGIHLLAFAGQPGDVIAAACQGAVECVVDGGYQRILRQWRQRVALEAPCLVSEVESEVVLPMYGPGGGAGRSEPAAATLRPKILSRLVALTAHALEPTLLVRRLPSAAAAVVLLRTATAAAATVPGETGGCCGGGGCAMDPFPQLPLWEGVDACLDALDAASGGGVDRSVKRCSDYHVGGEAESHRKLDFFLANLVSRYSRQRNDMALCVQSHLSPHVHYGQISVVYVAHRALAAAAARPSMRRSVDKYLDELVVRRELAINYILTNPHYDQYQGVPGWARKSLAAHASDRRKFVYTLDQFEACATHDPLWNASQRELVAGFRI